MNTEQKSLKLAELMGWEVTEQDSHPVIHGFIMDDYAFPPIRLMPYYPSQVGLAQFAAILLKSEHTKVMDSFSYEEGRPDLPPTQANILDEILRMNGVEI